MIRLMFFLGFFGYSTLQAETFQREFDNNKLKILEIVSINKVRAIEDFAKHTVISRITQLLNIKGIGKNTVEKISNILGVRFDLHSF